jgi:hypothetical protein
MLKRRSILASAAIVVFVGLIGLFNLMGRPRFASYHTVDVIQLLASGMCFGVGLACVGIFFGLGRFARSQPKID